MRIAALAHMGRDVALLERLAVEGHEISVIGEFKNPNLVVGLSAQGNTPWEAREKILLAAELDFDPDVPLEYRKDVADETYIASLN